MKSMRAGHHVKKSDVEDSLILLKINIPFAPHKLANTIGADSTKYHGGPKEV